MIVVNDKVLPSGNDDLDKVVKDFTDTGFEPEMCLAKTFCFAVRMFHPVSQEVVVIACADVSNHPKDTRVNRDVRP